MLEKRNDIAISDTLESVSEESSKVQSLLKVAWVGLMNIKDGCLYRFDPDKGDEEREIGELYGVMAVIEECVLKLQAMDGEIDRANNAIIKSGQ